MTMPSSGALNMGGTPSPVSVAQELGLGLTAPISMNQSNVRDLAGAGASNTPWSLSYLYGKSSAWVATTLATAFGQQAIDPINSVIYSTSTGGTVQKINSSTGESIWYTRPTVSAYFRASAADSSGSIWAVGYSSSLGASTAIYKITPTGDISTIPSISTAGYNVYAAAVVVGASQSVYTCGSESQTSSPFNYNAWVAKVNSAGALQWRLTYATGTAFSSAVAVDSSENVYWCGCFAANQWGLWKFNASGATQWTYNINIAGYANGGAFGTAVSTNVVVDTNNDVYIAIPVSISGNYQSAIIKLTAAGSITWARSIVGVNSPSANMAIYAMTTDTSNNLYVAGATSVPGGGGQSYVVFKFDSSGALQWQRTITRTSPTGFITPSSITVDNRGSLYVNGQTLLVKLPVNGSKTGTAVVGTTTYTVGVGAAVIAAESASFSATGYTATSVGGATGSVTPTTTAVTTGSTTVTGF